MKSVQEGAKTRQEGKLGGPKRAPRRAKMDPRGKCKYFFTPVLEKYRAPFLAHFWPLPRAYFFTFLHQNSSFYQHKTRFFAFICMNFHVFGAIFGASWASWSSLGRLLDASSASKSAQEASKRLKRRPRGLQEVQAKVCFLCW